MADVAIIHSPDKERAAARLAEAVTAAGFAVGTVEIGDPAGLADALDGSSADARILIWSRPLVSNALHSGDLPRIRQLRGLIEVSADGIAPPSRGDDSRVVSISGWRGQPFHPGWQRIHGELKSLCGPRKAQSEAPPPPPAAVKDPQSKRAVPAPPAGSPRPRTGRMMLGGGLAVLLVAGAIGATTWLDGSAPDSPPGQELREAPPSAGAAGAVRSDLAPVPEPLEIPVAEPAVANPPPPPPPDPASAEGMPAAKTTPDRSKAGSEQRQASKSVARPTTRPSPRAEPAKKYSRKNSKVMRQFCERSGRSTPQCRTFLRSVRGAEAD